MTKDVHFIMQGKGGVGKTLVSVLLTQYLKSHDRNVLCIDTDAVNRSFYRFKTFDVKIIPLLQQQEIDSTQFDVMVEQIFNTECDSVVIDSGASTFIPLNKYIKECELVRILLESDCMPYFHTILSGGSDSDDTLTGVVGLLDTFGKNEYRPRIAIWHNPHNGSIEWKGKTFSETKVYDSYKEFIDYQIIMPVLDKQLYGKDLELLLKNGQTFDESRQDASIRLMAKHRINTMQKKFYDAIQQAGF